MVKSEEGIVKSENGRFSSLSRMKKSKSRRSEGLS